MKNYILPIALFSTITIGLHSCKKEDTKKSYEVPTTYNFDSVDYSGQTYRLDMLTELLNEVKKANTAGVVVTAQRLKEMYSNTNAPFADATLNTSGKQLKDKTFATEQAVIEALFDGVEAASSAGQTGSDGVAGIVGTRLFDADGIEYKESIEKGLYGSLIYYQICEVYLSSSKIGSSIAKKDRQHHWDEAFGYYGVPKDFPTNKNGIRFLGKYGNDRDALISINSKVMNAYLKGRAAINNDDNDEVVKQAAIVKEAIESVIVATAIHYLNEANVGFGNDNTRNHTLSEFRGLLKALKFNSSKKITDSQLADLLNTIGNSNWKITQANILKVRNDLSAIYGLDAIKEQL